MKKHKKKLTQLHCLSNSFSQAKLFLMSIKEDLRQRDDVNGLVMVFKNNELSNLFLKKALSIVFLCSGLKLISLTTHFAMLL